MWCSTYLPQIPTTSRQRARRAHAETGAGARETGPLHKYTKIFWGCSRPEVERGKLLRLSLTLAQVKWLVLYTLHTLVLVRWGMDRVIKTKVDWRDRYYPQPVSYQISAALLASSFRSIGVLCAPPPLSLVHDFVGRPSVWLSLHICLSYLLSIPCLPMYTDQFVFLTIYLHIDAYCSILCVISSINLSTCLCIMTPWSF